MGISKVPVALKNVFYLKSPKIIQSTDHKWAFHGPRKELQKIQHQGPQNLCCSLNNQLHITTESVEKKQKKSLKRMFTYFGETGEKNSFRLQFDLLLIRRLISRFKG
jgi:hypothetical protein